MTDRSPKIFISYSWSSHEHEEWVVQLAERLMSNGVAVLLDKWDLKPGNDVYAFMEQCVTNPDLDKVLIICNKKYQEKADAREGGVGDETAIISPHIYGTVSQEKFIGVIAEHDLHGNPCLPAYLASRLYIDLSDSNTYEESYSNLLRAIYAKPLWRKPVLGSAPAWLDEDQVNFSQIRLNLKKIETERRINEVIFKQIVQDVTSDFVTLLNQSDILSEKITGKMVVDKIRELKPIRDLYIDYLQLIMSRELPIVDAVTVFFERIYNEVGVAKGTHYSGRYEHYEYFIWESFISTVAVLFHYEKYAELHNLLCHTYFLRDNYFDLDGVVPSNYLSFIKYFNLIEGDYKPKSDEPGLFSYSANLLIEQEKYPAITKESLTLSDILLFQFCYLLGYANKTRGIWYPFSYIYSDTKSTQWRRLVSRTHFEKIKHLFGVETVEGLKTLLRKHPIEPWKYDRDFLSGSAQGFEGSIPINDIGTLN